MKNKIIDWVKRYGTGEIIGFIFLLICSNLMLFFTGNIILSAFIATWAENLGFYGYIIFKDLKERRKKNNKSRLMFKDYLNQFRNTLIEFGPAEYLDSFLIRPFCLSVFPLIITNYSIAIIIGAMVANITYYIPTIISYEARKKMFKD